MTDNVPVYTNKNIAVGRGDVVKIVFNVPAVNGVKHDESAWVKLGSFEKGSAANPIGHLGNFFGHAAENDNADVPSSLKEVCLTQAENIRDNAFAKCTSIEKIDLNGADSIGENAFLNCSSLKNLVIPETVESIKANSLSGCSSLESLELPFVGTSAKSNEDLGVLFGTNVYEGSYSAAQASDTYQLPSKLVNLKIRGGTIAPNSCSGLKSVLHLDVGDLVTDIGNGSFSGMDSLQSLSIPFIGKNESDSSEKLGFIFGGGVKKAPETKTSEGKGTAQSGYTSGGINYYYIYNIPETLRSVVVTKQTAIPSFAFSHCDLIENVRLPNEATSIGQGAFEDCTKLACLNSEENGCFQIPENIEALNFGIFNNCTSAMKVVLNSRLVTLGSVFLGCTNISKINSNNEGEALIPFGLKTIRASALRGIKKIIYLQVSDSVESIGDGAFRGMDSLKRVSLPFVGPSEFNVGGSDRVFGYAFGSVSQSSNVKTSAGKGYTYQGYGSGSYYIPSGLTEVTITRQTSIPERAFYNCDLIESIRIPDGVDSIGASAFYGCAQLKRLNSASDGVFNLPSGVASVQANAFYGCSSATEFALPDGVESIELLLIK